MARTGRGGLSASQKTELWERWKRGQSLNGIARALAKHRGSIHFVLASSGGIEPPLRRRSGLALSLSEREEISRGLAEGRSLRAIASSIQRAPSTVSRGVRRHCGRARNRAAEADQRAWDNARRPKPCRLAVQPGLQKIVARKPSLDWSPEQISGWLRRRYPGDQEMQISNETIYRSLFVQARGVLKKELVRHLRTRRVIRRSKQGHIRGQGRGQIVDAVSIRERPAAAEDRAVPGHWEADLLAGSHNTHVATLVERQSRFAMLVKVHDLILAGRQAADWNAGQVGIFLAGLLGLPAVTLARKVDIREKHAFVERLLPDGCETIRISLPAVVIASNEVGELRYATLIQRREAKKKPIKTWGVEDIGFEGTPRNRLELKRLFAPKVRKRRCQFVDGETPAEAGRNLAQRLRVDGVLSK